MLLLEFKLNTKQGTTKERTYLFIFIKCTKKNSKKKNNELDELEDEKTSKAIEEYKLTVMIKRLMRFQFILKTYEYRRK